MMEDNASVGQILTAALVIEATMEEMLVFVFKKPRLE